MSQHANQHSSAPASSRTKLRGSGATYRASVQRQGRTQSSTKPAGSGKTKPSSAAK